MLAILKIVNPTIWHKTDGKFTSTPMANGAGAGPLVMAGSLVHLPRVIASVVIAWQMQNGRGILGYRNL